MESLALPPLPRRIRPATADDLGVIRELIVELAVYEREPDAARATEDQLGVGPVGFAVWFRTFSTWEGTHGIHLEDLFVRPAHRGTGLGRDLLVALARIAVHHGWARFEWAVLDWNAPSIAFYRALGAVPQDEWTTFRVAGPALTSLAGRGA